MAYPFLPVNPCCTDVVINDPCGCSSTITNPGCNNNNNPCNTHLTASSTIVYDGPVLPCIVAEPCDTLNVILQKIDEIICNLQTQINYLTNQVNNITTQVIAINGDIINIYNTLDECCNATTTTTSTTIAPTTTTTTTASCNCVDVIISQADLDDATGNSIAFFNGKVNLFPSKELTCDNQNLDDYYSVAGTYTYCLKTNLIPTIELMYVKNDVIVNSVQSEVVNLETPCLVNGQCIPTTTTTTLPPA